MIEIPSWAWGLMVTALTGAAGLLIGMVSFYMKEIRDRLSRLEKGLKDHAEQVGRRVSELNERIVKLEVLSGGRYGTRSA